MDPCKNRKAGGIPVTYRTMPLFHNPNEAYGPQLTDDKVRQAEKILGVKLPAPYVDTLKFCNGGKLRRNSCPTEEPTSWAEDHVQLIDLMGIGYEGGIENDGQYYIQEWGYPHPSVCISCIDGHTAVLLDYRDLPDGEEPPVVFVDMEAGEEEGEVTLLAPDFQSFVDQLVASETRYVVGYPVSYDAKRIQQAVKGLGDVTHKRYEAADGVMDWVIVQLKGIRGYENEQAKIMFHSNKPTNYPEIECSLIAELEVEDRVSESVIDNLNQRVRHTFGCDGIRIYKPHRWQSYLCDFAEEDV